MVSPVPFVVIGINLLVLTNKQLKKTFRQDFEQFHTYSPTKRSLLNIVRFAWAVLLRFVPKSAVEYRTFKLSKSPFPIYTI